MKKRAFMIAVSAAVAVSLLGPEVKPLLSLRMRIEGPADSAPAVGNPVDLRVSASSITDIQQQAQDLLNQELSRVSSGDKTASENDGSSEENGPENTDGQNDGEKDETDSPDAESSDSDAVKANAVDIAEETVDQYEVVEINSIRDYETVSKKCRVDTWSTDKEIRLNADLDFRDKTFEPIESFGGVFNGNGHALKNVSIEGNLSETGIFGTIRRTGKVMNLNVQGAVQPDDLQKGLGGIAGYNYGLIDNCTFSGEITADRQLGGIVGHNGTYGTVTNCTASGTVSGKAACGGIAGYNEGTINGCRNRMEVNTTYQDTTMSLKELTDAIDSALQSGKLLNADNLEINGDSGGIAGFSSGVVTSCTNYGTVGYEHVGYNIGGIVGRSSGFLQNNTNAGIIYGRKDVGGIVGQLQPYLSVEFTEQQLNRLNDQLDELNDLVNAGINNADNYSSSTLNHLQNINGLTGIARNSARNIANESADAFDDTADQVNQAVGTLQSSLRTVSGSVSSLGNYVSNIGNSVSNLSGDLTSYLDGVKVSDEDRSGLRNSMDQVSNGIDSMRQAVDILNKAVDSADLSDIENAVDQLDQSVTDMNSAVQTMRDILSRYDPTVPGVREMEDDLDALSDSLNSLSNAIDQVQDDMNRIDSTSLQSDVNGLTSSYADAMQNLDLVMGKISPDQMSQEDRDKWEKTDPAAISAGKPAAEKLIGVVGTIGTALSGEGTEAEKREAVNKAVSSMSEDDWKALDAMVKAMGDMTDIAYRNAERLSKDEELSGELKSLEKATGDMARYIGNIQKDVSAEEISNLSDDISGLTSVSSRTIRSVSRVIDDAERLQSQLDTIFQGMDGILLTKDEYDAKVQEKVGQEGVTQEEAEAEVRAEEKEAITKALMDSDGGWTQEDAGQMAEFLQANRDSGNSVASSIDELQKAMDAMNAGSVNMQDWLDSNDLSGGISDISKGLSDETESIRRITPILDKYIGKAGDYDSVLSGIRDAGNAVAEHPDFGSRLADALNSLASLNLQVKGISTSIRNNGNNLFDSLVQLENEMNGLNSTVRSGTGEGADNLRSITDQFSKIVDTLEEEIKNAGDVTSGRSFEDVSDQDISKAYEGRTTACINNGEIHGDTNIGGITGLMGVEYDLDPETDIRTIGNTSLDYIFRVRCIVDSCTNNGEVAARSNYSGGIAGQMEMGLVASSWNYGNLKSESNYVGGITGYSTGFVRGSAAKSDLSGGKYIGGIAGYGVNLHDNYAMVDAVDQKQYVGEIAGRVQDINSKSVYDNYYYSEKLYGINGVSYKGIAEGLTYEELVGKFNQTISGGNGSGALTVSSGDGNAAGAERFTQLALTFQTDGGVLKIVNVNYGEDVPDNQIPSVPEKNGFHGAWSRKNFKRIVENETITAEYSRIKTLLTSKQTRSSGLSMIEVAGNFSSGDELVMTPMPTEDGETERWTVTIPYDGRASHQVRYLAPDESTDVTVYVIRDGKREKAETSAFGKYITFTDIEPNQTDAGGLIETVSQSPDGSAVQTARAKNIEIVFSAEEKAEDGTILLILIGTAAGGVLILLLVILRIRRKRRKREHHSGRTVSGRTSGRDSGRGRHGKSRISSVNRDSDEDSEWQDDDV